MKLNRHWYLCDLIVVWRIAHCHIVLITITRKYFSTKMFHSNWHYQGTFQQYHSDYKILRWCICLHRRSIIFLQAFATDSLDSCCCARIWSYKSPDQKSVVTRWDQCWKIRPHKPQLDQEMCSHVRYCQERWKQTMWLRIFADKHTILTLICGVNSGALLWRILWHNAGWWSMQNCDNRERGVHWWVMIIWHRWICFDHIHYNNRFVFQCQGCVSQVKKWKDIHTYVYIYVLARRNICQTQIQRKQLRDTCMRKYLTIADISHHWQWQTFNF